MPRMTRLRHGATMRLLPLTSCVLALAFAAAEDHGAVTLTGNAVWSSQAKKAIPVTLICTPDGKGGWTTTFTADWDKKSYTYIGTLSGNLKDGDFSGEATEAKGKRKWTIKGTATAGALAAKHSENNKESGSFSLKPGKPEDAKKS